MHFTLARYYSHHYYNNRISCFASFSILPTVMRAHMNGNIYLWGKNLLIATHLNVVLTSSAYICCVQLCQKYNASSQASYICCVQLCQKYNASSQASHILSMASLMTDVAHLCSLAESLCPIFMPLGPPGL